MGIMSLFNVRVYGLLINEESKILVSDEFIRGRFITKFPGGGLEFGEGTRDCLVREFKEETGLSIKVIEHYYTTDFFQVSSFNTHQQVISIYYIVSCNELHKLQTQSSKFNFLPSQIQDKNACAEVFRWIDLVELKEDDLSLPIDKVVVNKILNFTNNV
jgi:8-oxo-dGTP diphosphatase